MSSKIAPIADALADLRHSEPAVGAPDAIDFDPVAFVKHERMLIEKLAALPGTSLADATAKAGELASLLTAGDYLDDLAPRLARALAADLAGLWSRAPVLGRSAPPAAPYPAPSVVAAMGHG